MNERINRVLEKMKEKGIDQLLVSDPLSIRFLTGHHGKSGGKIICTVTQNKWKAYIIPELSVLCIKYRIRRKYGSVTWMTRSVF